ncbi:hypothetical protein [Breznakia pachnodae]|uniref:ArpU family phage transcriptional regulator n=1 Tax=Breznakia pachnodae TaxID=265178 RepID=A0ABU0E3Y4_9FIRM|nr:hypothetical protein [Breznakia pachnodae]MDQ0361608.1 ArpU family phage transcriptional regulator [Breznakia pachnodae]
MKYEIDIKGTTKEVENLFNDYIFPTFSTFRFDYTVLSSDDGMYEKVIINSNSLDDDVTTKMSSSNSIIRFTGNGDSTAYEKRLIKAIDLSVKEEKWLKEVLECIYQLPKTERHVIIAKYIVCEKDQDIMNYLDVKKSKFFKLRSGAFLHLALLLPDKIRVREIGRK